MARMTCMARFETRMARRETRMTRWLADSVDPILHSNREHLTLSKLL